MPKEKAIEVSVKPVFVGSVSGTQAFFDLILAQYRAGNSCAGDLAIRGDRRYTQPVVNPNVHVNRKEKADV